MGMLHAHVSAAQKNLVMWCFCWVTNICYTGACFFLISNGGGNV